MVDEVRFKSTSVTDRDEGKNRGGATSETITLFSDMGQGNFKRRPTARLTLVADRAVVG